MLSRRMKAALVILLGAVALYGCGQKGPLYLPQTDTTAEQEKAAPDTDKQEDT